MRSMRAWSIGFGLLAIAAHVMAGGSEPVYRKHNVNIVVESCQGLKLTDDMIPSDYPTGSLPPLTSDGTYRIAATGKISFCPQSTPAISCITTGYIAATLAKSGSITFSKFQYSSSLDFFSGVLVDKNQVTIRIDALDGKNLPAFSLGTIIYSLPAASGSPSFNQTRYGNAKSQGALTQDNLWISANKTQATCKFRTTIFATQCLPGERINADSICEACPEGTYSLGLDSSCLPCREGYFGNQTGLATETCSGPCIEGHYCPAGSTSGTAKQCPAGTWSSSGAKRCESCDSGYISYGIVRTASTCDGPCPKGYQCPSSGTTNSTKVACSDSAYFCDGVNGEVKTQAGYMSVKNSQGLSESQEPCMTGSFCNHGESQLCPPGSYQDEIGMASCKPCTCGKDQYTGCSDQGRKVAPTCQACAITAENRQQVCGPYTVFLGCTGESAADGSVCLNCANTTNIDNSTITEEDFKALCSGASSTTVDGLPAWALGVVIAVALIILLGAAYLVRRKRMQDRERLDHLNKINKDLSNEQEIAASMGTNVNPLFRKVNPGNRSDKLDAASAEKIHLEEISEINKHKRALEEELRRLKMEAQQNEAGKSTARSSNENLKQKRKEFQGGELVQT